MPADLPRNTATARLRLEIRSDTAQIAPTRRTIENFANQAEFDEVAIHQIGLCVNEALANVIRHAYEGAKDQPIVVTAECRLEAKGQNQSPQKQICVTIRDWGNGQNPADRIARPQDPLTPGGVGMICLKELMDRITFVPQPDGMLLVMVKNHRHSAEN